MNYPKAKEWMWTYCVYLGEWEEDGKKYDLGVYVHPDGTISEATVYGEEFESQYLSGELVFMDKVSSWVVNSPRRKEVLRRYYARHPRA